MKVRWLIGVAVVLVALGAALPLLTTEVVVARADYPAFTPITDPEAMFARTRRFRFGLPVGVIQNVEDCRGATLWNDVKAGEIITINHMLSAFLRPSSAFHGYTTIGRNFELELPPSGLRRHTNPFVPGARVDVLDNLFGNDVLVRGATVQAIENEGNTVILAITVEQAMILDRAQRFGSLDLRPALKD